MASTGVASVPGGGTARTGFPREASAAELLDWDRLTVEGPGGHVYQSRTWAAERAKLGWRPLHVMLNAEHGALVLLRPFPLVGGASAYVPRGPIVDPGDHADGGEAAAQRVTRLADWLGSRGVAVVATDAEILASTGYGEQIRRMGFRPIQEIQPSRHRLSLELPTGATDDEIRAGFGKSTRQRIKGAERSDLRVARYDTAGWPDDEGIFVGPARPFDEALQGFYSMLEATGGRRGFRFGPRTVFVPWWRVAHDAGLLVYLEVIETSGTAVGGMILYRHGRRLTTVHSADRTGARSDHPGLMHLLRWRAIQLARREACVEMDLGGVDVAPYHRQPVDGDPMFGLYEHKRSFGADWVEMTGAHERVLSGWRYAAGRVTGRLARLAGHGRS